MKEAPSPPGAGRTIVAELEQAAAGSSGADSWLTFVGGSSYSYQEVLQRSRTLASQLLNAGLDPGDRVCIMLPNSPEFIDSWFGGLIADAVVAPLNTAARGTTLAHTLSLLDPKILIVDRELVARVTESLRQAETPNLALILTTTDGNGLVALEGDGTTETSKVNSGKAKAGTNFAIQPTDACGIMLTSGTSGVSKGVVWSHSTMLVMAEQTVRHLQLKSSDRIFTCLPLFHVNALGMALMTGLVARVPVIISSRFSLSSFWAQIAESNATVANLLGSMIPLLLKNSSRPRGSQQAIRGIVVPCLEEYFEVLPQRFGYYPIGCYGLADFGMPIYAPPEEATRPGSCGKVVPEFDVKIVDEWDEEVPVGEVGELVVRPRRPWVGALGYWRMPEVTVASWRNLWFHTGDRLRMDQDGWFYFVDRLKDSIRRRGEMVASYEVEQALLDHPDVLECAAYPVPSEEMTEDEVAVAVVLNAGASASIESIVRNAARNLPYFAVPRYLTVMEELPKTENGKIQKQELRTQGVTPTTWDREEAGMVVDR